MNVSGSTLEIDGAIGDGGQGFGFTQSGAGLLLLTGSSTYLGPTVVQGGTLQIGNGGSGASIGSTSNVALAANTLLLFNHNDSQTFPASIGGAGGMTQSGAGLLNLTNSNTYTGGTTVAGGTLELRAGTAGSLAGTLAPNSTVTVLAGATLQLNAQGAPGSSGSGTSLVVNAGTVYANAGFRVPLFSVSMTGGTLASDAGNGDGNGNYSLGGTLNATSDASGNPAVIAATQISLVASSTLNVTHGELCLARRLGRHFRNLKPAQRQRLDPPRQRLHPVRRRKHLQRRDHRSRRHTATGKCHWRPLAQHGRPDRRQRRLLDINGVNTSVGGINGGGTIDNVAGTFGFAPTLTIGNGNGSGTFSGTIQNTSRRNVGRQGGYGHGGAKRHE